MPRLFLAEECLAAGATPAELMQAQGFDPAPLALLKYDPEQPRVPAGSGPTSAELLFLLKGPCRLDLSTTLSEQCAFRDERRLHPRPLGHHI
ncbi:MAG: hypothetical protein WBE80_08595 [Methylocella sp.]